MNSIIKILLASAIIFACNKKTTSIKPQKETVTESVYASGSIVSAGQYQVFANVSGILDEVFVSEGDTVDKGTALFSIFNEASKLNKENAALAAEFSNFENNQAKINELKKNIELAQKKLQQDSLLWIRQGNLWKQNIGSKLQYEQSELAYENSRTALESARLRLKDLVRQLEFNSGQSKKNLQISSRFESDYTVKSEIKGKVYDILKEKGEMVNVQTPLAIVGSSNNYIIELQVDEYDIVKIKLGMKVFVSLDSYKGEVYEASISKINPIMNERSKTFTIEAIFINSPPSLYPNLTVEANIVIKTKENALTIPRQYLQNDSFVYLKNGDKKAVNVGLKDYRKVEIISGLSETDELILPE